MSLISDIELAKKHISKDYYFDDSFHGSRFAEIYPFTTENINGYFKNCNFKNKSLLTVGSSADQILNAITLNCNDITCFDINPFTRYYYELKKAAILALDIDQFLAFFCYRDYPVTFKDNKNTFDINTYHQIAKYLSDENEAFWSSLYADFAGFEIRKTLFSSDEEKHFILRKINNYLDETNYYKLKNNLNLVKPSFVTCDIKDVNKLLKFKYDIIALSNISKYLQYMFDKEPLENFKRIVLNLKNNLNENGQIFIAYLYNTKRTTPYCQNWELIYDLDSVFNTFKDEKIEFRNFVGMKGFLFEDEKIKDAVLVYKK